MLYKIVPQPKSTWEEEVYVGVDRELGCLDGFDVVYVVVSLFRLGCHGPSLEEGDKFGSGTRCRQGVPF